MIERTHWPGQRLTQAWLDRLYQFASYLLAVFTVGVLAWSTWYIAVWPEDGILWSSVDGRVERVDPSGPSYGRLQQGDVILAWDGNQISQHVPLYADKRPGDQVTFSILRNGHAQSVAIVLVWPQLPVIVNRLEPLSIAFVLWLLGVVVLAFKTSESLAPLFHSLFSQVACYALILGTLSTVELPWADHLFLLALWLLGPLVIHLHLHFPVALAFTHRRGFLAALYGVSALAGAASLTQSVAWLHDNPYFHVGALVSLSLSLGLAVVLLFHNYRRATSAQLKQNIRIVALGAALGLIPLITFALLPDALFNRPLISYNVAFFFLLATPCAYGYSIVRRRLLRLDRHISRGLEYVILVLLLVVLHLSLDAVLERIVPPTAWHWLVINLLFALVVVLTFVPLRNHLQKLFDWVFYGGWYNYHTVVQKVSQSLDQVIDAAELTKALPHSLKSAMRLECACLLLRDRGQNLSLHKTACPHCELCQTGLVRLDPAGSISQYLQREQGPVIGETLRTRLANQPLTPDEQKLLACVWSRLWVPLHGRDGLMGVLILGPKQCDDLFDDEDLQALRVIARQASITIQNASLLFQLQQRAADMEKLHQQLLRAREEERKRLARELHDEIIQSLVGLNFGLSQLRENFGDGRIDGLQRQVHQLTGDLRKICIELRPPALDSLGLTSALRSRLRELGNEGTLKIELIVEGDEDANLPEELQVCLYRVMQEALANIQKHSHASQASVRLAIRPDGVLLTVQDDGCGFWLPAHLNQFMDNGHFGLAGMRERLDLIGGRLTLRSAPGQGTCLEAWVPVALLARQ